MSEATDLTDRIRAALSFEASVREVRMFGGIAFMVNDKMAVHASRDGSLLARVDPATESPLLERAGAARAEMGPGRSMGPGWIRVAAEVAEDDLAFWLDVALDFNKATGT